MDRTKWIIGGTLSVFLCAAGVVLGQQHQPTGQSMGRTLPRLTPALKARQDEKWRLDQAAIAALDAGHYAEAEDDARQSLSLGVGSGLCQDILASALNAQNKDQEALQAYKMIADQGGDFPRNLVPYALLLLKAGQWKQAVAAYNKVLPFLPDGDIVQANSHFSPNVPQPGELAVTLHIAQGLTYIGDPGWGKRLRHEEAMSEFGKALQLAPNSDLANYYYGYGWQRLSPTEKTELGSAAQAKAALQKAVKLGKGDVKKAAQKALLVAMNTK